MCLAVPGKLITITNTDALTRAGRVDFNGIVKEINLSCVPEAKVGDYLTVHVGIALSIVDQEEAERVFEYLHTMDELVSEEDSRL